MTRLAAAPDYFQTLGLEMVAGREFTETDGPGATPVVIVNQSFVNQYWPGQSAIGRRVGFRGPDEQTRWYSVVGVASNIMQSRALRDKFVPIVYIPFRQAPSAAGFLFVRTREPAGHVAAKLREVIERSAPAVTLEDYSTLQAKFGFDHDRMDLEHAELGKHAAVAPIFGVLALLLGSVGLYAVMAHSVGRRTREIGGRMALGAEPGKIRKLIVGEALTPVFAGIGIGLAASLGVNRGCNRNWWASRLTTRPRCRPSRGFFCWWRLVPAFFPWGAQCKWTRRSPCGTTNGAGGVQGVTSE